MAECVFVIYEYSYKCDKWVRIELNAADYDAFIECPFCSTDGCAFCNWNGWVGDWADKSGGLSKRIDMRPNLLTADEIQDRGVQWPVKNKRF